MQRLRLLPSALFIVALGAVARAAPDPSALAAQLRTLHSSLSDATDSRVAASLPLHWEVDTPERRYSISTTPLRSILMNGGSSRTEDARQWLDRLARQLEDYAAEPSRSTASERAKLDRILARPEFRGAAPPSALERLSARIRAWIYNLLEKIFSFANSHPSGAQLLFWIVLVGAVGLLALWVIRLWSQDTQLLKLPTPKQTAHEVRTWEEWLAAARRAAEKGDSRQAIRCAYWAGIVRLQGSGTLPADRTLTPREYLGLLPREHPSEVRQPLASLTQGMERFWYARRPASNEDFRESLRQLAALGCNVE